MKMNSRFTASAVKFWGVGFMDQDIMKDVFEESELIPKNKYTQIVGHMLEQTHVYYMKLYI